MAEFDIARTLNRDIQKTRVRPVSPTDISQYVRLDQCQRYLRLQLHSRAFGESFLRDYGVKTQTIPEVLTRSGAEFEAAIEREVRAALPTTAFGEARRTQRGEESDNGPVLDIARALLPGDVHVLFQPRLAATVGAWSIRGDVDILRLEREADGRLRCLIADIKSSTAAKVEHRLQVAVYHEMLDAILAGARIEHAPIELAILYRGPVEGTTAAERADPEVVANQRAEALAVLGSDQGLLERIEDAGAYTRSVHDLLTGPQSVARRILAEEFEAVPFHLTYKCDGCQFNELCMKRSAETDDLSLLPHLTEQDKTNLRAAGIATVNQLAALKEPAPDDGKRLLPAPGYEDLCRTLAATWPIGQRLDEVIHRAHRYVSWKRGKRDGLRYIPHKGYGTLPAHSETLHPNLVTVYIDAQHDYLHDRIYMLGARIVGCENGIEQPARTRNIVHLAPVPPASNEIEQNLFVDWIEETIETMVALAAPDDEGNPRAPIHLVFVNRFAQKQLLNGLGRHLQKILGVTALYDFITQLAAFDSPIASFLEQEIREQKNYPMVCQSLQAVASFLRFSWVDGEIDYKEMFRTRLFDFWSRFDEPADGERPWYTGRARFNSQIPLEYAYAAWGQLDPGHNPDAIAFFELTTPSLLAGFHAKRLEAMEHIAKDFPGNKQTQLTPFSLPDLAEFEQRAPTLAHALDEFITIERFVELGAWQHERLATPEQRVLNGVSLIVRYDAADQDPATLGQLADYRHREAIEQRLRDEYFRERPDAKQFRPTKEQRAEFTRSLDGIRLRLRLETQDLACSLEDALALTTLKDGARLILRERWTIDSRLPENEQRPFAPTAKQLLYGQRVTLVKLESTPGGATAHAIVEMTNPTGGRGGMGFYFGGPATIPEPGEVYTLEPDINNFYGYWAKKTVEGLLAGESNPVYDILTGTAPAASPWPAVAAAGQQRFLDGLVALHAAGAMHDFEASKHEFIGHHGASPLLLVQGPPGTGKSYTTAFAILARIQGAMAADIPFRVFLGCKTHAATDVLLHNVQDAIADLRRLFRTQPAIMERFFDRRLLDLPLYRLRGKNAVRDGITELANAKDRATLSAQFEELYARPHLVAGATPGATYGIIKDRWTNRNLYGHHFVDCVVLDEASQMSIPEAIMATLPLQPDGRLIVVGDHRQMPPIVSHDWANETRRTFEEFQSYESLFYALLALDPPKINFERSFRLHADLAEFLRREIYQQDGIDYHSTLDTVLPRLPLTDDFVAAVLAPEHPLVVIVHDEVSSQHRNAFEQALITPILETLADERLYALTPEDGLGVVVPHRAQRAALQEGIPALSRFDPETGERILSAVDTVERFQGDERIAIFVSATESDPEYLLATGDFLLDPRRLTVALSRAKQKMVLVASRSIFELFSADEETFRNAQIWKNLLNRTCTVPLWSGTRDGKTVEVWGNA